MPLFEATWPETTSILISAHSAGEALFYIQQFFGDGSLYQLDELIEIKSSSFLLVRRCGRLSTDVSSLSYQFCPDSEERVFLVEERKSSRTQHNHRSVIVVNQISELPSLVLWHYDMLDEDDYSNGDLICELWEEASHLFHILELDTERPGILMSYEYCNCPPQAVLETLPFHPHKSKLE